MEIEIDRAAQVATIERLRGQGREDAVRFPKETTVLEIVEGQARGEYELPPWQFKAAVAALPFRHPKQASQTILHIDGDLGARLQKAREAQEALREAQRAGDLSPLLGKNEPEPRPVAQASGPEPRELTAPFPSFRRRV